MPGPVKLFADASGHSLSNSADERRYDDRQNGQRVLFIADTVSLGAKINSHMARRGRRRRRRRRRRPRGSG